MVHSENSTYILNVEENSLDKCATASRDLTNGDEIICENITIFGPVSEPKLPICIGCGVNVNGLTVCFDCGWPVCDTTCDKLTYHKMNECEIFKKCPNMSFQRLPSKKNVFHQYDCILPLRMLLLIERSPEKWKFIEELNSFIDIRRNDVTWKRENIYVIKYIRQKCKLKKFDEELIHKVCGIINANSFHVTNTKNNIRCIYKNSHHLSHSCIPNTSFVILPNHDFRIYIRAARGISKGEKLTYSKTKVIMPTLLRRQELIQCNYLSCCCKRCADSTELGSYFSSLKCLKCDKGFLLSVDPLDFEADWKCSNCKFQRKYTYLKKLYNQVEKELNKIKDEISSEKCAEKCEKLLKKYETVFHFNHAFIVYLKYYSLLRSLNGDTFQISKSDDINLKIIKLYEILQVFNVISPGYTVLRGTTYNLLYKAYVIKAKLYGSVSQNEKEAYTKCMSLALKFLDETEAIMVIGKPFSDLMES